MKYKEITIHLICWLAFATLIFYWQNNIFTVYGALLHTIRAIGIGVLVFYINLYVLLPRFFEKAKYLKYTLFTLLVVSVASYLFNVTHELLPPPDPKIFSFREPGGDSLADTPRPRFDPRTGQRSVKIINRRRGGEIFIFAAFNTIPMLFFSTILWLTNENRKRRQREVTLKNESLQSEMRFLKSQINPHFLFNALNNIYSLSFTRSDNAPQMIMKLSEMLRHVVYDSSNLVKIEKEISYINNYIDFQRLKIGTTVNIRFDHQKVDNAFMIEPMLLTPFVENAFKHSDIESNPDGYIQIALRTEGKQLHFEIENSFSEADRKSTKDSTPGIGIQNVTKRLELAYPGRSKLEKEARENTFTVKLQLTSR